MSQNTCGGHGKFVPWFYLTQPSPSRFPPRISAATVAPTTERAAAISVERQLDGFQKELLQMQTEDPSMKKPKKSLSKFLGGMHNVDEMLEDVRRAEKVMPKLSTPRDDCTLSAVLAQRASVYFGKPLEHLTTEQFRNSFRLHPSNGIPLFPGDSRSNNAATEEFKSMNLAQHEIKKEKRRKSALNMKKGGAGDSKTGAPVFSSDGVFKGSVTISNPVPIVVASAKRAKGNAAPKSRGRPAIRSGGIGMGQRAFISKGLGREGKGRGRPPTKSRPDTSSKKIYESRHATGGNSGVKLTLKLSRPSLPCVVPVPANPPISPSASTSKGIDNAPERLICRIRLPRKE